MGTEMDGTIHTGILLLSQVIPCHLHQAHTGQLPLPYQLTPILSILNSFLLTSGYVRGVKVRYELQAI